MEENGKFKVVTPPAGTTIGYVPDGYTESEVDGGPFSTSSATYVFAPAFSGTR